MSGFWAWWAARRRAGSFRVDRIPFADLDRWRFEPDTGNLTHDSGRFFRVVGLRVDDGEGPAWCRPVVDQPEHGILGILVRDVDGVRQVLLQAKMEPGNAGLLQLSPTVQATWSNYTRVHGGRGPHYLEYFTEPQGEVLVDELQSEQGSWCWHKHNRNMVVRVTGDVPAHPDFRWLPLSAVRDLLHVDDLVNMDTRTVLAGLTPAEPQPADDVLAWLEDERARCRWKAELVPLSAAAERSDAKIAVRGRPEFTMIAVQVEAGNREVTRWTQPLLSPRGIGLSVLLVRDLEGQARFLVRARPEPGLVDRVEIGPTVQVAPGERASVRREPYLRDALTRDPGRVRHDVLLSEEGGRFYRARTRYRVVEVDHGFPAHAPRDFRWVTAGQLAELVRRGRLLNIEARTLLACVLT